MHLKECFAFVDKNIERFVQILQSLIRIPSVSEDPDAPVRECGQALMKIMEKHNIHKPNEQLPLALFIKGIKYAITTFAYFAEWTP